MFSRKQTALLLFTLFVVHFVSAKNLSAEKQPPKKIKIVVVGDSTAASYKNPPKDRPDLTGWGQVLGEFFNDKTVIDNRALSGRSSKSFIKEGRWKQALAQKPDYVFIQFGHNDCPGKGDRYTNPKTDFQDYIRQYVQESQKIGAQPILVTPMTRRNFQDGKIRTILRPYAEAMIKVAKEEKVPVIDLHASSMALFNKLGDTGSADFSPSVSDRTHYSRKGALAIAGLVVNEIPRAKPSLKKYLMP